MGQRTQVVFVVTDRNQVTKKFAYHLQWGQGRRMPMFLMEAVFEDSQNIGGDIFNLFASFTNGARFLLNDETESKGFEKDLQESDFTKLSGITDWYQEMTDNNNGGMVVWVKQNENYEESEFKIGLLAGWADVGIQAFKKWLSLEEFVKLNQPYMDNTFQIMFVSFLEHFNIEIKH